mmetsp:Transcript_21686/g.56513  ORF Transcript_21686/g.56513 Transcript_21686/m.56513 type:complete len:273 (+) Transcript_21686:318-1136(+)
MPLPQQKLDLAVMLLARRLGGRHLLSERRCLGQRGFLLCPRRLRLPDMAIHFRLLLSQRRLQLLRLTLANLVHLRLFSLQRLQDGAVALLLLGHRSPQLAHLLRLGHQRRLQRQLLVLRRHQLPVDGAAELHVLVDHGVRLHAHRARAKLHRLLRLLCVLAHIRNCKHQAGLRIAPQGLLQKPGEFGVSERHVRRRGVGACVDAHAQLREGEVDGLGLTLALPLAARLLQSLTAGQVDNKQLTHLHLAVSLGGSGGTGALDDSQHDDGMAAA